MLCKELDTFFDNETFVIQVELTNGEAYFLDYDRPNVEPSNPWLRLKAYCDENKFKVRNIWAICEQGKLIMLQHPAVGAFAIRKVAWANGVSVEMFCVGQVVGDKIQVASFVKKPFYLFSVEDRPLEGNEWLVI